MSENASNRNTGEVPDHEALVALLERYVRVWHGVEIPNAPARRMAAALAGTIAAFERLRTAPRLEDLPGDFAATLLALREPGA